MSHSIGSRCLGAVVRYDEQARYGVRWGSTLAKILSFREWEEKTRKKDWKTKEEPYLLYLKKVLLAPRSYPKFYSAAQAETELYDHFATMLDGFAKTLEERLAKPAPVKKQTGPTGGTKTGDTKTGGTKTGGTKTGGKDAQTESQSSGTNSQGSGKQSFTVGTTEESSGNEIIKAKPKPTKYDNKPEFGPVELRTTFLRMPKNPDLVMKADNEKEIANDATLWGVVRPSFTMNIGNDNLTEFQRAEPGTPWLGFVRIGRRVGREEDKIALIQIVQSVPSGMKFVAPTKDLRPAEPWHKVWLDRKFAAQGDPKIKKWNGWDLQALKQDKSLELSDTGCFFGFFLVKASDGGPNHYFNFRCASLNRVANAYFSDVVPDFPFGKMNSEQRMAYQNLMEAARGGFSPRLQEIQQYFPNIKLRRASMEVDRASKKVPLTWAKAVVETIQKF